ncbi:hypothetical protein FB45DRAFT_1018899 [Roridomyces roridus]|uniref:Uncharacterized protein n=1 Tax=Roridomyces roridus TaxID=1738132 RepID=A0AAD7CDS0_9AGAR|nr:hypothetical protein FB45DRAFT_1018899 [Roridomyces roridus]
MSYVKSDGRIETPEEHFCMVSRKGNERRTRLTAQWYRLTENGKELTRVDPIHCDSGIVVYINSSSPFSTM